jgi:hypothetical protein
MTIDRTSVAVCAICDIAGCYHLRGGPTKTIDITLEAVEHLCKIHEGYEQHGTVATLRALSSALSASQAETDAAYEKALDAASDYTQRVYGDDWKFLSNPIDRERILASIPKGGE